MRNDALGLFWSDLPVIKIKKERPKRQAPEPTWLRDDHLPGLEEALQFNVPIMSVHDLIESYNAKHTLIFDIECYWNYFLIAFKCVETGKIAYLESYNDEPMNIELLRWIVTSFKLVGFNSINYDMPITTLAINGYKNELLKVATNQIIVENWKGRDVLKQYKCKPLKNINHVDLIEVAPLRASLKIYGGRIHTKRMQDLPFSPDKMLSPSQVAILRYYCINDLRTTQDLYSTLNEHCKLRDMMSMEFGIDLRSKSDAQIAEAILGQAIEAALGRRPVQPVINIGTRYFYKLPSFIRFQSPLMQYVTKVILSTPFVVGDDGSIEMPRILETLKIPINGSTYQMGIGGLHSTEKSKSHYSDKEYQLFDYDVTSFYPYIILILKLFPEHIGQIFLTLFKSIVDRRIKAKNEGLKAIADALKIVINGTYGKLGSKYSIFYSPNLLIQVTITGQLVLLMLIEQLELMGISVVSANTDGIVVKCQRNRIDVMQSIVHNWERNTGFQMEAAEYKTLHSRDVNNYLAIKADNTTKTKGAYANPWNSTKNLADRLHKNPTTTICIEAVENYLIKGIPIEKTIRGCNDIRKFLTVRNVKKGAVKIWEKVDPPVHSNKKELVELAGFVPVMDGKYWKYEDAEDNDAVTLEAAYKIAYEYFSKPLKYEFLGKAIRWYYAIGMNSEIVIAANGNKVPRTDGAKPLMDLPDEFPNDVNYDWYITECEKILKKIGYNVQQTLQAA